MEKIENIEEWLKFVDKLNTNNTYIGGTCALLYALDLPNYLTGPVSGDFVSILFITNCSGNNKKELVMFGKPKVDKVGSLPVKYYHTTTEPKITNNAVQTYLTKWNENLKSEGEHVKLILCLPKTITQDLNYSHIEVVLTADTDFALKSMKKIEKCFKFHYRKLQIVKNIVHSGEASKQYEFLEYINMISAAWHNISSSYIRQLFCTSLGKPYNENIEAKLSISSWCTDYNVPVNIQSPTSIDNFISCDGELPSVEIEGNSTIAEETTFDEINSTSKIEAYQAMKRLVSYLQSEVADQLTIKSAKVLEDHLECGALSEIHIFFANKFGPISDD